MSRLQSELEYEALRSTIRDRGTLRMWALLVWFSAWGAGRFDPLFITIFGGAATINFFSAFALTTRRPGWLVVSGKD